MTMLAVSVTQLPTGVEGGAELAATAITFALLPAALALCTAFPRIFVTLSILRQGLGIGSVPGNLILTGLAAALTFAAMGPTLDAAWKGGMAVWRRAPRRIRWWRCAALNSRCATSCSNRWNAVAAGRRWRP